VEQIEGSGENCRPTSYVTDKFKHTMLWSQNNENYMMENLIPLQCMDFL